MKYGLIYPAYRKIVQKYIYSTNVASEIALPYSRTSVISVCIHMCKAYYTPRSIVCTVIYLSLSILSSVRSTELVSAIKTALSSDNDVKAAKILGGALKQLKLSRLKPDVTLNSSLMTLVREHPDIFSTPAVIEGLVLVLKREPSIIFKVKSNPSVYVLAAQLLLIALKDSYDWPEVVAKVSFKIW